MWLISAGDSFVQKVGFRIGWTEKGQPYTLGWTHISSEPTFPAGEVLWLGCTLACLMSIPQSNKSCHQLAAHVAPSCHLLSPGNSPSWSKRCRTHNTRVSPAPPCTFPAICPHLWLLSSNYSLTGCQGAAAVMPEYGPGLHDIIGFDIMTSYLKGSGKTLNPLVSLDDLWLLITSGK